MNLQLLQQDVVPSPRMPRISVGIVPVREFPSKIIMIPGGSHDVKFIKEVDSKVMKYTKAYLPEPFVSPIVANSVGMVPVSPFVP